MKRSEEIQREIDETRARIDHDVQALQDKMKMNTNPAYLAEEEPTKLALLVGGVLLLLILLFRPRRKNEASKRSKGQAKSERVENVSWMDDDMRDVMVSLLTAQGLRWLQEQAGEPASRSVESAAATVDEKGSKVRSNVTSAVEEVVSSLDQVRQRVGKASGEAASTVADKGGTVAQKGKRVASKAGTAASDAASAFVDKASTVASDAKSVVADHAHTVGVKSGWVEPTFSEKVAASVENLVDALRPSPPTAREKSPPKPRMCGQA